MRLIVTGGTGFVGRHIVHHATARGAWVVGTHLANPQRDTVHLDVTNVDAVRALFESVRPDAVINAAATLNTSLTGYDANANWAVNAQGAANVARVAYDQGVRLVHVSSDAVFAGRPEAYIESDLPDPIYPYGAAKAAADLAVAAICPTAVMARPSLITGDGDELSRREQHILDLASGRIDGVYFTDEVRCPVGVNDFARACLELAVEDAQRELTGALNVTGPEPITLHGFAVAIARRHGLDPLKIPASDHKTLGVTRPGCVMLDTAKARSTLGSPLRGVTEIVTRSS